QLTAGKGPVFADQGSGRESAIRADRIPREAQVGPVAVGRCEARARGRGFAAAASSFAAAAFSASSASLARRSERRRVVLAASAWRASASGLTNFEELFFAMVEYRLPCFERAEVTSATVVCS